MHNRVIAVQAVLALLCTLLAWVIYGSGSALAAGYGGALALANTFLLARRVALAGEQARTSPRDGVTTLYIGAIQRFVLVLAGLALGMGYLGLAPLPMLIAFAAMQAAYLFAGGRQIVSAGPDGKLKP